MEKKWLKKEDELLIDLYNKCNRKVLINELNSKYTWEAIKNRARKLNITKSRGKNRKPLKWSEDRINLFKKMWSSDTSEEIKKEFTEFSYQALKSAAKRFNVKRSKDVILKNKLEPLLTQNNFNSYWLGFIMADGHFSNRNELKISVSTLDFGHLKILGDFLNVNINKNKAQVYGKYIANESCMLSVMDVKTLPLLKEFFNVSSNKTYNSINISKLQKKHYLSFLCGFIDGDGCITQSKTGKVNMLRIQCHSSWIDILMIFSTYLTQTFNFNPKVKIDKQGYANFAMYRNKEILTLKEEMLKLKIPYLKRKWDKII